MIEIQTKIHDRFSIEFKVGFSGREGVKVDHFDVNSWIFVPNALDINKSTYSKDRFYTDMKSNVRLLTPSFSLMEMTLGENAPLQHVRKALEAVAADPSQERLNEFEFQLKLFGSIFKSALRDASSVIIKNLLDGHSAERCAEWTLGVRQVLKSYRELVAPMDTLEASKEELRSKMAFVDEFMSHQVEIRSTRIMKAMDRRWTPELKAARTAMEEIYAEEEAYKIKQGYSRVVLGDSDNNRKLVHRHSQLKKYVESVLYLRVNTTQDGVAVKQISFSLAAGLAMMVSLLVTMPFQKYLGNYPMLIFITVVVIYMLKDRIKELTRWLFAYQLKDKYYDNKTVVSIKDSSVGWIKEGMDFIADDKVPAEVLKLRNRNKLEADNQVLEERIILYRKRVEIDNAMLKNQYDYDFKGINDIIRYHINYLTLKMDNPESSVDVMDEQHQVQTIKAERVYILHFVMQFKWEDQVEYKAFQVLVSRNGILEIKTNES